MDYKSALVKAVSVTAHLSSLEKELLSSKAPPEEKQWEEVALCSQIQSSLADAGEKDFTEEQRAVVSNLRDAQASVLAQVKFDERLVDFLNLQFVEKQDEKPFDLLTLVPLPNEEDLDTVLVQNVKAGQALFFSLALWVLVTMCVVQLFSVGVSSILPG